MKDSERTSPGSIHEAVDALFDGELSREEAKRLLARADGATCEDVAKTHRIVSMLKRPVRSPDLTSEILARVEGEREFLDSRWRRVVRVGRMAVAASLLVGLLSVAVAQRMWPEATSWRQEPKPMSNLLRTTEQEASQGVREIGVQLDDAIHTTRQVACDMLDSVDVAGEAPTKVSAEARYVLLTRVPAKDVRLKQDVTPVAMYWTGAGTVPVSQSEWQFVCTPAIGAAPTMGAGVSVQASLISVWTAEAPKSGFAALRAIERQQGASVPGLEFSRSTYPGLP